MWGAWANDPRCSTHARFVVRAHEAHPALIAEVRRLRDMGVLGVVREDVDLDVCPDCGGPADNGHDRCVPPSPYLCARCAPVTPR